MTRDDGFPLLDVERRRRGWRLIQVADDGRRTFLGQRRYATEAEAREHLESVVRPRVERIWARLVQREGR